MSKHVYFFETASLDSITLYLAQLYADESDYLDWLLLRTKYPFRQITIDSLDDLVHIEGGQSDDLFAEVKEVSEVHEPLSYLINLSHIQLQNPKLLKQFVQFCEQKHEKKVFFYSHSFSFNATSKKEFAKFLTIIPHKKVDFDNAKHIAIQYRNELQVMLKEKDIETLLNSCISYQDIIDKLDFISLTKDHTAALESILPHNNPALFMLGFNPQKPNAQKWLKYTKPEEYQLAISVMMTKLSKLPESAEVKVWKKNLIKLDKEFKNTQTIDQDGLWKLFLYEFSLLG